MKKLSLILIALFLITQVAFSESIRVVGHIFQTLDEHNALVMLEDWNVVYVKTLENSETILYDGKKLNFTGKILGTYQYEDTQKIIRTVPVVEIE
ncbi:MAG: hypothetical protein AB7E39_05260 [Endomicrobiaceae bacterium]